MAGAFYGAPRREFNAKCDPIATSIVYATSRKDHLAVGLDVTERCRMKANEVRERFVGEPLGTVLRLAETWFRRAEEITFHDPLAAALIFHPELAEYDFGTIHASIGDDERDCGFTCLQQEPGPDRVARTIDRDGFFRKFFFEPGG